VQVTRRESTTTVWGQIRPGDGARGYEIQRFVDGAWERVAGASTGSRGYLTRTVRAGHGDRLRLVDPASGLASPTLVVV
jgi:hypothetical protein